MHSMAAKRGFTHFGWQLFVALMVADIDKSELPENRPQAKQHVHCPKCNSTNVKTDHKPHLTDLHKCMNCGKEWLK